MACLRGGYGPASAPNSSRAVTLVADKLGVPLAADHISQVVEPVVVEPRIVVAGAERADVDPRLLGEDALAGSAVALAVPDRGERLLENVAHHELAQRIAAAGHDVAVHVDRRGMPDPPAAIAVEHLRPQDPLLLEQLAIVDPVAVVLRQ